MVSETMKRQRQHKNGGNEEKNKDIISDLPECILLHILSFLDTKYAVQTCTLSKRWKDLWKHVPTLTLISSSFALSWCRKNLKGFSKFVSWILSKRDASTALHTLDFDRTGLVEPHLLKRIVKYAVSHHVQRLRIVIKCDIQHLPSCFFSCRTLTSLDLYVAHRIDGQRTLFPNSLNLPALTNLSIHAFAFCINNNGRVEPFSTFNRLNSLIIDNCKVLDAQNLSISSSTLANLTIQSKYELYREIELSTPSLCTFVYTGISFPKLSGNHLRPVKHLNIDADTDLKNAEPSVLLSWLIELTNIRSLIVSSTILQVLSLVPDLLKLKFPSLCNLKSLKVEMKPLSYYSSKALIDAKLAQLPTISREEVSKIIEEFKFRSSSIPDGIVAFLLQNSPSAEVHIID
ncbi:F-box/LRR-repeat protein [Trifolium pratense]|uniref:F-box/LRR-repeat protein n=1 Tax=Trifolium pratense TaxID=57577 RepID=A0A2K3NDK4_TRIPR|nr:F-box/LRR-repeat protein [Trifolium pratense]